MRAEFLEILSQILIWGNNMANQYAQDMKYISLILLLIPVALTFILCTYAYLDMKPKKKRESTFLPIDEPVATIYE